MDNNILDATQLDLTSAHPDIVDAIKQVANGKPIILHQDGYQVAAVISISDLHLLERLIEEEEDRIDIAEVKEILAEVKEQGTVAWQEVKAKLGL